MSDSKTQLREDIFLVDDEDGADGANKYLLFTIGTETYGLGILYVTDIIEMQRITEVPDMPDYVKGVINLRGRVLPVMDIRLRFGMPAREYDDRTCIIILQHGKTGLGVVVDTVSEVSDIDPGAITDPPDQGKETGKQRYVQGLARTEEGVHILLDVQKLLARDSSGEEPEDRD